MSVTYLAQEPVIHLLHGQTTVEKMNEISKASFAMPIFTPTSAKQPHR